MKIKKEKPGIAGELASKHRTRLARVLQELKEEKKCLLGQRSCVSDLLLFWKWAHRVGKGWYGFNLGHIPPIWTQMLDEFLGWLEIQCPDFEIRQIKMKFGAVRIHVGTKTDFVIPNETIRSEIVQLENLLRLPSRSLQPVSTARKIRQRNVRKP